MFIDASVTPARASRTTVLRFKGRRLSKSPNGIADLGESAICLASSCRVKSMDHASARPRVGRNDLDHELLRTPSLGDFYAELARRPPHRAIILGLNRKQSLGMSAQFGTSKRSPDAIAAAAAARRAQS